MEFQSEYPVALQPGIRNLIDDGSKMENLAQWCLNLFAVLTHPFRKMGGLPGIPLNRGFQDIVVVDLTSMHSSPQLRRASDFAGQISCVTQYSFLCISCVSWLTGSYFVLLR